MAAVVPTRNREPLVGPTLEGSGVAGGFSPADLRDAYQLPSSGGAGMTVAVTIAYDNPKAESDLAVYRSQYGLPPCTTANGCFRKVNQQGEEANYPEGNTGWALETSLDLDMVSATCPQCHILLVEADSAYLDDMGAAVEKAAALGADVISNSWATEEFEEETTQDPYFDHPGIPTLFASGDWGYGVEYPAASPHAIAVGGTSLRRAGGSRGWSESAWLGAGSGCSEFEPKPAWQNDSGCTMRTVADVAAVADTETPVSVYDSYGYSGWQLLGGTSVATPVIAGIEALSSSAFRAAGPSAFWRAGNAGDLFDILDGENGSCAIESDHGFDSTYLCQGDVGYDGPTGWGSPNGPLSMPVAITEDATVSSTGKATLHGAVGPQGLATEYRFEYGETTSYGTSVPVPNGSAGSGSDYVDVSQVVEGLKGQTPYHYRLTAVNTGGTFHGADRIFGTTPPTVTTGSATGLQAGAATVHASVNPEGLATTYYFEYGPTVAYGRRGPARAGELNGGTADVAVSADLNGLSGGTPYHYRVVARNAAGTVRGTDRTLITNPAKWVRTDMPQPPNSGNGEEAFSVACWQSNDCIAVGSNWSLDLHASATLAERWDGKAWTPIATPNPPGLQEGWEHQRYATLVDVACPDAGVCMAIGHFKGPSEVIEPLVERWNGSTWSIIAPAIPAGAQWSALESVSCVSPTSCLAVGAQKNGSGVVEGLAERWDGSSWSIEATPIPGDAKESRLTGISCPSPTACVTVGRYETASGATKTLAAHWDGSGWSLQTTPNPGERSFAALSAVSCTSATACTAVGRYQLGPAAVTLAMRWNGTQWTTQSTLTPYSEGVFEDVSCATSTSCTATGYFYNTTETDHGWRSLVERWNGGSSWSTLEIAPEPAPEGWWHESWLLGVSCAEAEACNAVGYGLAAPEGGLSATHAFSQHEVTPPFAAFTSAPSSPHSGQAVSFDASSTVDPGRVITDYSWDFGDGTSSTESHPSHTYAHAGDYVVKLTVVDDLGRSGEVAHIVTVLTNPPSAAFSVSTPQPTAAQPVFFDGTASSDSDGALVSYSWDFGDGSMAGGPKPSHIYSRAGDYDVTLVVTDNDGASTDVTQTLTVANAAPHASFSVITATPTATEAVAFDGSSSSDPDGTLVAFDWDFGDGATGSGSLPAHTYEQAGLYNATLTVTDDEGKSAEVTHSVVVAPPKEPPVETLPKATPGPGPSNEVFLLAVDHDRSSGGVALKVWVPGAGALSASDLLERPGGRPAVNGRFRPTTVMAGGAGAMTLRLVPTKATRKLLKRRRTMTVDTVIGFAPQAGARVEKTRAVVLHMVPRRHSR